MSSRENIVLPDYKIKGLKNNKGEYDLDKILNPISKKPIANDYELLKIPNTFN